jgi:hypothetical protein
MAGLENNEVASTRREMGVPLTSTFGSRTLGGPPMCSLMSGRSPVSAPSLNCRASLYLDFIWMSLTVIAGEVYDAISYNKHETALGSRRSAAVWES